MAHRSTKALRLLASFTLLAAILACGVEGELPDESLRPAGTGWFCVEGASPSRCARSEEACGVEATMTQAASATCAARDGVDCLTYRSQGEGHYECYGALADCVARRGEVEGASLCSRWR